MSLPCSQTPAGPPHQAINDARARPPQVRKRGLLQRESRGSITRLQHSLSTLRSAGYPTTAQDSLPAAGQALPGGTGYPQGLCERFQVASTILLSRTSWRDEPFSVLGGPPGLPQAVARRSFEGMPPPFLSQEPASPPGLAQLADGGAISLVDQRGAGHWGGPVSTRPTCPRTSPSV